MVKLNKPVRFPKEEDPVDNIDETNENDQLENTQGSKTKDTENIKEPKGTIHDRFDFVLTGLCTLLFLIASSVLLYSFLAVSNVRKIEYLPAKQISQTESYPAINVETVAIWNEKGIVDGETDEVLARSYFAYNPITHQVYFSKDVDEEVPIASIAKLLTAVVALEKMDMDQTLIAQRDYGWILDWDLGINIGDRMTLEAALNAMLISSYNDAAYLVADNYPGGYDAMIDEMNKKAERLGMENSYFNNPSGLDNEELYSTSRDLKRLVQEVITKKEILDIVARSEFDIEIERNLSNVDVLGEISTVEDLEKELWSVATLPFEQYEDAEYEVENVKLQTSNELLGSDNYIRGLKTGYTEGAGPSFVSYYYVDESEQLITILLSAQGDRFEETSKLVEMVRNAY